MIEGWGVGGGACQVLLNSHHRPYWRTPEQIPTLAKWSPKSVERIFSRLDDDESAGITADEFTLHLRHCRHHKGKGKGPKRPKGDKDEEEKEEEVVEEEEKEEEPAEEVVEEDPAEEGDEEFAREVAN